MRDPFATRAIAILPFANEHSAEHFDFGATTS
jgi:hypothetical protein